ncbi:MAG TPA: hypothetical protein VGR45_15135 [Stellaceae bacterium]|nr:hypothetical protein [Stellaceae bacterium]
MKKDKIAETMADMEKHGRGHSSDSGMGKKKSMAKKKKGGKGHKGHGD